MSLGERLERSPLGGIVIGIALIALAPIVYTLLGAIDPSIFQISITTTDQAGNQVTQTVDFSLIFSLVKGFTPLLMVLAGLYKLGVRI